MLNETEDNEIVCLGVHSGENVKYVRAVCKCGHSIYFLRNRPAICRNCGRTVYPTRRTEFKDKVSKTMKRRKNYE